MLRVAAAGVVSVVLLSPVPAEAAAGSWRVKAKIPGQVAFTELVAGSARSAWMVGYRVDPESNGLGGKQVSSFFDGTKWRPAPMPKGAGVAGLPGMPPTLAASGAGAWALSPGEYESDESPEPGDQVDPCAAGRAAAEPRAAGGIKIKTPSKVLRWNHGKWTYAKTFKDVALHAIAVRGKEVFAFGVTKAEKNVMLRFDGRHWRKSEPPLHAWDVQTVGRDVWVQGFGEKDGTQQVWRFDGTKWFDTGLQRALPADYAPTKDKPGLSTLVTSMSSSGRGQVSVGGHVTRDGLCPGNETEFGKAEPFLLHFDGKTWRRDALKGMKGLQIDEQVPDGRGGLYATVSDALGFDGRTYTVMHGTPGGTWTRETLPKGLETHAISAIPGGGFWVGATGKRSSFILRK